MTKHFAVLIGMEVSTCLWKLKRRDDESLRGYLDEDLPSPEYLQKDAYYEDEICVVATVLWDLYDNKTVFDYYNGSKEDEDIHLSSFEIWRKPTNIYDLSNYYDEKEYWKLEGRSRRRVYFIRDFFEAFSSYEKMFEINFIPGGFTRENRA